VGLLRCEICNPLAVLARNQNRGPATAPVPYRDWLRRLRYAQVGWLRMVAAWFHRGCGWLRMVAGVMVAGWLRRPLRNYGLVVGLLGATVLAIMERGRLIHAACTALLAGRARLIEVPVDAEEPRGAQPRGSS
jgi:hypothetical protein